MEELKDILEKIDLGDGLLDDLVFDAKSEEASRINNGGVDEQLDYLLFSVNGSKKKFIELLQKEGILPR